MKLFLAFFLFLLANASAAQIVTHESDDSTWDYVALKDVKVDDAILYLSHRPSESPWFIALVIAVDPSGIYVFRSVGNGVSVASMVDRKDVLSVAREVKR